MCTTYHLKEPTQFKGWIKIQRSEVLQTNKNSDYRNVLATKLIRNHLLNLIKTLI